MIKLKIKSKIVTCFTILLVVYVLCQPHVAEGRSRQNSEYLWADNIGTQLGKPVNCRFIKIKLPGAERTLSLAEVEVFDQYGKNIALNGNASQSSVMHIYKAHKAVDGVKDNFTHSSSAVTNPWWELDLGAKKKISKLVIYNRAGLLKRMVPAVVMLLNAKKEIIRAYFIDKPKIKYDFDLITQSGVDKLALAQRLAERTAKARASIKKAKLELVGDKLFIDNFASGAKVKNWAANTAKGNKKTLSIVAGKESGTQAIQLDYIRLLQDKRGQNCFLGRKLNKNWVAALEDYYIEGIGFWFKKIEGKSQRAHFRFNCLDKDGKKTIAAIRVPMIDKEWRYAKIKIADMRSLLTKSPIDAYTMKEIYFIFEGSIKVAIADLALIVRPKNAEMQAIKSISISPQQGGEPVIDGNLNDLCWKNSAIMNLGLRGTNKNILNIDSRPPKLKTKIAINYGKKGIYIGARLEMPAGGKPRTKVKQRDQNVYEDDCLEIFYAPSAKKAGLFYQMTINSNGVLFDKKGHELNWNPKVKLKTKVAKNYWNIELMIPYEEMGVSRPKAGEAWSFNIKRIYYGKSAKIKEHSAWATLKHNDSQNYGKLIFNQYPVLKSGKTPTIIAKVKRNEDKIDFIFSLPRLNKNRQARFEVKFPDGSSKKMIARIKQNQQKLTFTVSKRELMAKGYAYVTLLLADKNKPIAFYYGKTAVSPSVVPLKYDKFVLWPPPQKIKFNRGNFTISNSTHYYFNGKGNPFAVTLLKNKLKEIYGIRLKPGNSSSARIMLTLNPENRKIKPEGYTLKVDSHGIKIEAKDEAGLYYGVRTLINVFRLSTPQGQPTTARYIAINDWPGLPVRGILITLTSYVYALRGKTDLNRMKEFLYRYIAGNRYNTLIIDPVGMLKWDSHPEIYEALSPGDPDNNPPFTKAELKELIAFARKHYITNIIPSLNTPGHSSWLLRSHPELAANPTTDANGKKLRQDVLNTRHPDTEKIVFALIDELCDIMPGDYFHAHFDEVWWRDHLLKPEDRLDPGVPKKEIFLEWLLKVRAHLKKRGRRMIIWNDMLLAGQFGAGKHNVMSVVPRIPKDVIIQNWWYQDPEPLKPFVKQGFTVWRGETGYAQNQADHFFDDYGLIKKTGDVLALLGGYRPWSSGEHKVFAEYNHLMVAIAGANFWNKVDAGETHFVKVSKKGSHIIRALQEIPQKNASGLFVPIDLAAIANRKLSADSGKALFGLSTELDFSDFPTADQTIAGIPFKFSGKAYSPENKNDVKSIVINEKINSFYVMHTAHVNKAAQDSFFPTIWTAINDDRGYLAGYYRINYSDGSKVDLPLFLLYNITIHDAQFLQRYLYTSRWTWSGSTKNQQKVNPEDNDIAVQQIEFINPFPAKKVKAITMITEPPKKNGVKVKLALLGLTIEKSK
ncbi:MAG: family 20 glycosylhydrolase [Victivallaceae bacterium]|nr:family 20 glycosylhydrolase [Victivallaceae bacterium]